LSAKREEKIEESLRLGLIDSTYQVWLFVTWFDNYDIHKACLNYLLVTLPEALTECKIRFLSLTQMKAMTVLNNNAEARVVPAALKSLDYTRAKSLGVIYYLEYNDRLDRSKYGKVKRIIRAGTGTHRHATMDVQESESHK
jgi:hypothetical protein